MNKKNNEQARLSSKAVAYARVSSKEQEKEGFSIAAQQKSLRHYADENGITIAQEFIDIETAKSTGRKSFEEMLRYLVKHPSVRDVLVEKTDRLYRNLKDWVTLDSLDIKIHLVKEGEVLSRDSRSSVKFVHGIKVLMAKNYIDNLSEEARKGQLEKAEQGYWPTKAPLGYNNAVAPNGKRIIEIDPDLAPIIASMFGWYASGGFSLKEVAQYAREVGLAYRKTGGAVPTSSVHAILRNRIYTGEFDWKGQRYLGRHEPIINRELWEEVQAALDAKNARRTGAKPKEFAFSGLMTCGHCGCSLVGEMKKGRYIYYHCTGWKGKCPEPYVREEVLEQQFSAMLGRMAFSDATFEWIKAALHASHKDEQDEHEAAVAKLQAEFARLKARMHAIYIDKLDGRIDTATYEELTMDWRIEQDRCRRDIDRHLTADRSYLTEGVRILDIARGAQKVFVKQVAAEKRRLLNFVLSNCAWPEGRIIPTYRKPFDMIAELATVASEISPQDAEVLSEHPGWLRKRDSNPRPPHYE